jgi:signal peptidase
LVDGLVLVAGIGVAIQTFVHFKGYETYVVGSGSMQPVLQVGEAVMIRRVPPEQLTAGDIVTFNPSAGGRTITHRIIEIRELDGRPYLRTKGDANSTPDVDLVPAAAVVGRVDSTSQNWGSLLVFIDSTLGRFVTIVIPLGILMIEQIFHLFRLLRPHKEESPVFTTTAA